MHVEDFNTALIERYLDAKGLRFFRGREGDDFLVLFSGESCQLHVLLGVTGRRRDVLTVRVSPAGRYPAEERCRLMEVLNEWNRTTHWPKAFVRETSDPRRIGVVGENSYPLAHGIHLAALGSFVDCTIKYAVALFDKIDRAIELPSAQTLETWLARPAGGW